MGVFALSHVPSCADGITTASSVLPQAQSPLLGGTAAVWLIVTNLGLNGTLELVLAAGFSPCVPQHLLLLSSAPQEPELSLQGFVVLMD
jgi:hypothetical protein